MEDLYTYPRMSKKAKVTFTLESCLLKDIDRLMAKFKAPSRSALVASALREWLKLQAKKNLEKETEEYYRSFSAKEKQEDKSWTQVAARGADRLWD